jgi:hypothetical protein
VPSLAHWTIQDETALISWTMNAHPHRSVVLTAEGADDIHGDPRSPALNIICTHL